MTKILCLLIAGCLMVVTMVPAQAPAQVVRTATYKAVAGDTFTPWCVFSTQTPDALTGIHIECQGPTASFKQDTTLASEPALGQTGQFSVGNDVIKWYLRLPIGGRVTYTIDSNGKVDTGTL